MECQHQHDLADVRDRQSITGCYCADHRYHDPYPDEKEPVYLDDCFAGELCRSDHSDSRFRNDPKTLLAQIRNRVHCPSECGVDLCDGRQHALHILQRSEKVVPDE